MSLIQSLILRINSSFSIFGPLVSPAKTTLLVVVKVSQATRDTGSFDK